MLCGDRTRTLILIEILNRVDDLGAAARATDLKAAELERLATIAGGDEGTDAVVTGSLLVDSAASRRLVARFPESLRTRFPGSSAAWARTLAEGALPPGPGTPELAWIDTRAGRIHPLRWRA